MVSKNIIMTLSIVAAFTLLNLSTSFALDCPCGYVQDAANYGISDFCRTDISPNGYIVSINPNTIQQLPKPLQEFFLTHECAHVCLNHPIRLANTHPNIKTSTNIHFEFEADCYAVQNTPSPRLSCNAIVTYFNQFGCNRPNINYPRYCDRVAKIIQCCQQHN